MVHSGEDIPMVHSGENIPMVHSGENIPMVHSGENLLRQSFQDGVAKIFAMYESRNHSCL